MFESRSLAFLMTNRNTNQKSSVSSPSSSSPFPVTFYFPLFNDFDGVIDLDGYNPYWNESTSFALTRPELAQIIFEVYLFIHSYIYLFPLSLLY